MKRHEYSERWFLSPFRHLLHDHRLWGIRRKTVVPAFALGLFIACMPFPGHILAAVLAGLALRVNIPVAALTTFVSNPVTMPALYYFCYRLGATLLSIPPRPVEFEMSLAWLRDTFVFIWQPMLLGSVLCGAFAALAGFVFLDLIWRNSLASYKTAKRHKRRGGN